MNGSAPKDPNRAVDYMIEVAPKYAKAKAERVQLEEFRKSKKALLMSESTGKTVSDRETYAYSHPDYIEVINGLAAATEAEENYRWLMKAAELRVEIWRSMEASNRTIDRVAR